MRNADRAARGAAAFNEYVRIYDGGAQSCQENMTDMLTDLRHFAGSVGVDIELSFHRSADHYVGECLEEKALNELKGGK